MLASLSLALAFAWVKANAVALATGFATRHLSPSVLASLKEGIAWVHDKVQAVLSWVHSKLGGTPSPAPTANTSANTTSTK